MDLNARIEQFQQAIRENPADPANWIMLGLCGLMAGQQDQMAGLFQQRDDLFGDGVKLYFDTLASDFVADRPDMLDRVAALPLPALGDAYDAVTIFAVGAAKCCRGEMAEGLEILGRLKDLPPGIASAFSNMPHVRRIGELLDMFFTAEDVSRLQAGPQAEWKPAGLAFFGAVDKGKDAFVIFTLADQAYFERFGDAFLTAMLPVAPVHAHVINGKREYLEEIAGRHPGRLAFSIERFSDDNLAPYCGSSRFLHIQGLMERYQADILSMDIDVESIHDFDRVVARFRQADVTLFKGSTTVPWLFHWATCIYFKQGAESARYLDALGAVIRAHLKDMIWYFDQCALISIHHKVVGEMAPGSLQILNGSDGFLLHDFITPSGGLSEKLALRKGMGLEKP